MSRFQHFRIFWLVFFLVFSIKILLNSILSTDLFTYFSYLFLNTKLLFFLNFRKKNILRTNKVLNFFFKMQSKRPLSPHLSIHKYVLTAVFSIFHRFTGIALSVGAVLLALWTYLIAMGEEYFIIFQTLSSHLIFKIFLFLWTLAIFYHLFNGIRYLFWSYGKLMQLGVVYKSGYAVLFLSALATILVWASV